MIIEHAIITSVGWAVLFGALAALVAFAIVAARSAVHSNKHGSDEPEVPTWWDQNVEPGHGAQQQSTSVL